MKNKAVAPFFYCLILFCLICSCSLFGNTTAAQQAVERFHAEFNAGNYQKLWAESDDLIFKHSRTESVFMQQLTKAKEKLGTVKGAKLVGSNSRSHQRGTDVYLTYRTEFTNGAADEKFTYVFIGDKVFLEGYSINY